MAHRAGLTRKAAAHHRADHIELVLALGRLEGLVDDHAQHGAGEIFFELPAVHGDPASAWFHPDPGNGVLALACGIGAALFVDFGLGNDTIVSNGSNVTGIRRAS